MRHTGWKIAAVVIALILSRSPAFSDDISGLLDISTNHARVVEDGEETSSLDSVNQNYYLKLEKYITPLLSYQFNFRANLNDSTATNEFGEDTKTYRRLLEPGIAFFLRNSIYDLNAGYRREEDWETANLTNEGRQTSEFYFARFNVNPVALPSLSVYYDKQKEYDHGSADEVDHTNDTYSVSSTYVLPSRAVDLRFHLNYTHATDKTPLTTIEKTISENFSGNYNIGYSDTFRFMRSHYFIGYQGNFVRGKRRVFASQTGSFLFQRTSVSGLYERVTNPFNDPDLDVSIDNAPALINEIYTDNTGFNLDQNQFTFESIGIEVAFAEVDRLIIYYRNNGVADPINWRIYSSNNNSTWNLIATVSIAPTFDSDKNVYRYEIPFPATSAVYFKAVNTSIVSKIFTEDVEITEIEAYGTEDITDREDQDVSRTFNQRLNFSAGANPHEKLTLTLDYSVERRDQNQESYLSSFTGILTNIFDKSIEDGGSGFRSNITRDFGVGAIWQTHSLLTTTARFQKNENFDNRNNTDAYQDTYSLSFYSNPLPTLDANLSLVRSERFNFDEKDSVSDSYLLSIGAQLYRYINMINDIGYTETETYSPSTLTSKTRFINGTVSARVTRTVSSNLNYGITRTSSEAGSTDSKNTFLIISYQPGRIVNISGNFRYTDSNGDEIISEGVTADWLPLPALRLNLAYQHSKADPVPTTTDSINGFGIWYLTKFADLRLSSGYIVDKGEEKIESYNVTANINCRF